LAEERIDLPAVSVTALRDGLARLGICPGDTVLMHSSLKSLGRMDGGADGVIDGLLAAVGPAGHAIVPTHTYCYVRSDPAKEAELAAAAAASHDSAFAYDPAATPSKVGLITEVFRKRPGAVRSSHPTHSLAAIGPRADDLMSGHTPTGGTFNIAGPHGRYVRWGAKILFLGIDLSSNTTYHAVEEWLDLPYLPDNGARVAQPGSPAMIVTVNQPCGHRNFYRNVGLNLPNPVSDTLEDRGLIRHAQVGPAELRLAHSRDVIRVTIECELATPGALLCRQGSCEFCHLGRHHCIRNRRQIGERAGRLLAQPALCDPASPRVE
jgi:aminoglycoside 3-N-acetyltransferase